MFHTQSEEAEYDWLFNVEFKKAEHEWVTMEFNENYVESQEEPPVRHPSGDFKPVPQTILDKFYNSDSESVPLYNVNTNLTDTEIELVVSKFKEYDVWDQSTGKLSMPRQSKFEMEIPTVPEVPT